MNTHTHTTTLCTQKRTNIDENRNIRNKVNERNITTNNLHQHTATHSKNNNEFHKNMISSTFIPIFFFLLPLLGSLAHFLKPPTPTFASDQLQLVFLWILSFWFPLDFRFFFFSNLFNFTSKFFSFT